VSHRFRLLMTHDRKQEMVLQPITLHMKASRARVFQSEIQVEQIQRSVMVHKHQVMRIVTLLWIKVSPSAFN
jgi:hypothetical protein